MGYVLITSNAVYTRPDGTKLNLKEWNKNDGYVGMKEFTTKFAKNGDVACTLPSAGGSTFTEGGVTKYIGHIAMFVNHERFSNGWWMSDKLYNSNNGMYVYSSSPAQVDIYRHRSQIPANVLKMLEK